jgi:hypothetical protein
VAFWRVGLKIKESNRYLQNRFIGDVQPHLRCAFRLIFNGFSANKFQVELLFIDIDAELILRQRLEFQGGFFECKRNHCPLIPDDILSAPGDCQLTAGPEKRCLPISLNRDCAGAVMDSTW